MVMKVFNPEDTDHVLSIIPRRYVSTVKWTLYHNLTDSITGFTSSASNSGGYLLIPFEYTFVEGGSYEITVNDNSGALLYRGMAYATSQTDLENYKLTQ